MLLTIIVAQKFLEDGSCFSNPCYPEFFEVSSVGERDYTDIHEYIIDAKEAELEREGYKILGYADDYETANQIAADNY